MHDHARTLLGGSSDVGRDPVLSSRLAAKYDIRSSRGSTGPICQAEHDRYDNALLDPAKRHGQQRELQPIEAQNRSQLAHPKQPRGDVDEDRLRQVPEQPCRQ